MVACTNLCNDTGILKSTLVVVEGLIIILVVLDIWM